MEGEFFLIQRVELEQHGMRINGLEIIGHERRFDGEPSPDIKSRFYDNMGNTLDYVYEAEGDTLTIRHGHRRVGLPGRRWLPVHHDQDGLSGRTRA